MPNGNFHHIRDTTDFSHVNVKRVNNFGYLSAYDFDEKAARSDTRVAVIGDSYVEAMQVGDDKTFHHLLQDTFPQMFFYAIGLSGAPLSQYLAYARFAERTLDPTHYVFVIIDNDFTASWLADSSTWRFHYFDQNEDMVLLDYAPSFANRIMRESAFIRYLHLDLKLSHRIGRLLAEPETADAAVDTEPTPDRDSAQRKLALRSVTLFLERLRGIVQDKPVLLVLDGDRNSIYRNRPGRDMDLAENAAFEHMIEEAAAYPSISVLDMQKAFNASWETDGNRFEFPYDWHWNPLGHRTVAEAIANSGFLPQ